MELTRRHALGLFGAGAAGAGFAACGGGTGPDPDGDPSSATDLRVVWWGDDTRTQATLEMLDIAESELGNVTLTGEGQGYGGYFDKITTQLAGGGGPDIIQMDAGGHLVEYGSRGALADLSEFSDAIDTSEYADLLEYGTVDGKLVGVPLSRSAFNIFFNPVLLDELGVAHPADAWTYEDFEQTCREVLDASDGEVLGCFDGSFTASIYEMWHCGRTGNQLYGEDGQRTDTVDLMAEWFQLWKTYREDGLILPPDIQADTRVGDAPNSPLVLGTTAMIFEWSTNYPNYGPLMDTLPQMQINPESGDHPTNYLSPTSMWSINAATDSPARAAAVIDQLINNPDALAAQGMTRGVPVSTTAMDTIRPDLDENTTVLVEFTERLGSQDLRVRQSDVPAAAGEVNSEYVFHAQEAAFGRLSPAEAAQAFFELAESIL